jgi:DNA-directed RNA polymerase subunit RPC12/RpoP
MKLKFWQAEFEFDRDDAKIVIPLILLLLGLTVTPLPRHWLLAGFAAYYAVFLFLAEPLKKWIERQHRIRRYRCPYCKSLHTVELGLQEYLGDVPYYWYRCNDCGDESVFVDEKLIVPGPGRKRKLTSGS